MNRILEVTPNEIERLSPLYLTKTLKRLLSNELKYHHLNEKDSFVSLNINAPDGGEDGSAKWTGSPENTTWLPSNNCLFQCKATSMTPRKCYNEMFQNVNQKILKKRIASVLDEGGSYILFTHKSLTASLINERIQEIRNALKNAGKKYYMTVNIKIYDANEISKWANLFLSSIIEIKQFTGQTILNGLQTWDDKINYRDFQKFPYIFNEKNHLYIKNIKEQIKKRSSITRITGLSGLGKTRMVLEVFRPDEDKPYHSLNSNYAVYLDMSQINLGVVIPNVRNWRSQGLKGILIVDNCNLETHYALIDEVTRSESYLSLITIDYSNESTNSSQGSLFINVEPSPNETIRSIFSMHHNNQITHDTLEKIVKFSDGFPQIAILLVNANIDLAEDIGHLNDKTLADKLVWGQNSRDTQAYEALKACSIFNHVGFENDVKEQYKFISETICNFNNSEEFYKYVIRFKNRGIIQSRGDFISVVPKPLAIRLAAEWWQECPHEKAEEILNNIPENLVESLCEQMRKLHSVSDIQNLTTKLCGPQGSFGNAKVLNSKRGSRIFRSLAELNPTSTSSALKRIFEPMSNDNVLRFKEGRRNLVLALEKLSFWEKTFDDSAIVLFKMAISENELWANNATGQLIALFKVLLPGTQANLNQRSKFLLEKINGINEDNVDLVLSLCSSAFETSLFSRSVGVEDQASRPVEQDYTPSRTEMRDYWSSIIKQLVLKNHQFEKNISIKIKKLLGNELRGFVCKNLFKEIDLIITEFKNGEFWQLGFREICASLEKAGENAPEEIKKKILNLQKQLSPVTLQDNIQNFFTGEYLYDSFNQNEVDKKIDSLVDSMNNDQTVICDLAKILTINNIIHGHALGRKLAEKITDLNSIFNSLFSELQQDNADPSVIGGIISYWSESNPDRYKKALDLFYENKVSRKYLLYLIRVSKFTLSDLDRIFILIDNGVLDINIFIQAHAIWVKGLPSNDIKTFIQRVKNSPNEGISVAFVILHSFYLTNNIPNEFQEEMLSIITENKFLNNISKRNSSEISYWTNIVTKFIEKNNLEVIDFYSKELINMLNNARLSFEFIKHSHKLLKELVKTNSGKILEYIIEILNDCDKTKISWLSYNLTCPLYTEEPFYFDHVDIQILEKHCTKNAVLPSFLAGTTRIYERNADGLTILPIAKMLLNKYSDNRDVIEGLSSNIKSFTCNGSDTHLFKKHLDFFNLIKNHSKTPVKNWASEMIDYHRNEIQRRDTTQNEEDAGIYRHQ